MSLGLALAATVAVAAAPLWMPIGEPRSPCATRTSEAGEVRQALRDLVNRVDAARDAEVAWVFGPIKAAILNAKNFETKKDLPAARVSAAEKRLASLIAERGEPLTGGLLAQVADGRSSETVRCILIRVLEHVAPERLAPSLVHILEREPRLFPFAEASIAAGRLAPALPEAGLVSALVVAVNRARGWGRQYPIVGLQRAGVRDCAPAVSAALNDADPAVRRHAALYLGWAGHTTTLARIDRMSRRDPDAVTRRVAQDAVGRLIGIALPAQLSESQRRELLDAGLLPRLAMFRGAVHE